MTGVQTCALPIWPYSQHQYGVDYMACCGADIEFDHLDDCLAAKALEAARELRDNLNLEQFAAFFRSMEEQK